MLASAVFHVPSLGGRVRVIFTPDVTKTWYDDGVKEFNITRVLSDSYLLDLRKKVC